MLRYMKNLNHFIIIILIIILIQGCNQTGNKIASADDVTGTKSDKVSAQIDGKDWKASNAYYSLEYENIVITAISENFSSILLNVNSTKKGTFQLGEPGNKISITTDDAVYYGVNGTITINEADNQVVSGEFSCKAVKSDDSTKFINISAGKFEGLPLENNKTAEQIIIPRTKQMLVNSESGEVTREENPVEIMYYENVITFKYKDKQDKSFSVKVKSSEKNGTSLIFYADDSSIESVTIDAVNKNQITVWYKNGNTLTLF
jgi:hypothetical protein